MAQGKTSFILYTDLLSVIKKIVLKDREDKTNNGGELFLHILEYVNDNDPIPINFIVDMVFEPIKTTLKRDLKKFEFYIDKQRENGAKGGRPKKAIETQITQPFIPEPKKADSVTVTDSVSVTESDNEKSISNSSFKNTLLKNENWKKTISTHFKITDEEVVTKLNEFYNHLETDIKTHPNLNEFAKHFKNWIPVNKEKNDKSNSNTKRVGSNTGYQPAKVDRERLIRELATDAKNGNIPGDYSQKRTGS